MRFWTFVAITAIVPGYLAAQEAQPWGSRDFSSKRIGAQKAGTIANLVQIDPDEEPYHLTPARPRGKNLDNVVPVSANPFDPSEPASWFWSEISPKISDGSPDRLKDALGRLSLSDQKSAPSWNALAAMVVDYGKNLTSGTEGTRVSPAFALAVLAVESGGRPDVVSSAGAQGLMQLMPATAERFGVSDAKVPDQNISGGAKYLNFLLRAFGDDPVLALAAYNAGEGAVAKHKGVPPYKETRNYVPKVLSAWAIARMFCTTPPEKVTDPCTFIGPKPQG